MPLERFAKCKMNVCILCFFLLGQSTSPLSFCCTHLCVPKTALGGLWEIVLICNPNTSYLSPWVWLRIYNSTEEPIWNFSSTPRLGLFATIVNVLQRCIWFIQPGALSPDKLQIANCRSSKAWTSVPCVGARVVRIVVGLEAQPRAPTYSLAALGCMTRLATKDAHLHAVSRTLGAAVRSGCGASIYSIGWTNEHILRLHNKSVYTGCVMI